LVGGFSIVGFIFQKGQCLIVFHVIPLPEDVNWASHECVVFWARTEGPFAGGEAGFVFSPSTQTVKAQIRSVIFQKVFIVLIINKYRTKLHQKSRPVNHINGWKILAYGSKKCK
jgi:hypothetical protein